MQSETSVSSGARLPRHLPCWGRRTWTPRDLSPGSLKARANLQTLAGRFFCLRLPSSRSLLLAPCPFPLIPRSAQSLSRCLAGQLSVVDDEDAVDRDVGNALAVLIGLLERGEVAHGRRVERDQIGGKAGLNEAAVLQAGGFCGEGRHLADRFLEPQDFLVAHIVAEDARGRPPASRVRGFVRERAIRRFGRRVGPE